MTESGGDWPAALTDAVNIINRLYDPNTPRGQVPELDKQLRAYQQGELGWQLADALLFHPTLNARFIAALTFNIKINQQALGDSEESVLNKLVGWFVNRVGHGENQLVLTKLSTALVAVFMQPTAQWQDPVRRLLYSMAEGEVFLQTENAVSSVDERASIDTLMSYLHTPNLRALLSFLTLLPQDASKIPHSSHYSASHARLGANIEDAVAVLANMFRRSYTTTDEEEEFHGNLLECYQAWIKYARIAFAKSSTQIEALRMLVRPLMNNLLGEESFEATADFFADLFTNNDDDFITREHFNMFADFLRHDWGRTHLQALDAVDGDEQVQFGLLVLAFGQATATTIVKGAADAEWIVDIMHTLTRSQNHDTIDQGMIDGICNFWEAYANAIPPHDDYDEDSPEVQGVINVARKHWAQGINELCHAASLPLDARGEFIAPGVESLLSEFRHTIKDTIQVSYHDFGVLVLKALVGIAMNHASSPEINAQGAAELALYCLADLSTSMEYQPESSGEANRLLEQLFSSQLFTNFSNSSTYLPMRLRKRAIGIIADQKTYFKSNPDRLLSAFEMLFITLCDPALAEASALAIRNLSDAGRERLVPAITRLLDTTNDVLRSSSYSEEAKEYVVTAVASVAQAMKRHSNEQIKVIDILLTRIYDNHMQLVASGNLSGERRREVVLSVLKQFHAVGEALQPTEKVAIVILDDDEVETPQPVQPVEDFNTRILSAVAALFHPREDGEILDAIGRILSITYREQPPGYFHFPPAATADLLTSVPLTNAKLESAIALASSFLSSRTVQADTSHDAKLRLISFICNVVEFVGDPTNDPVVSQHCVVFISRVIPTHVDCLRQVPADYISMLFVFTLKCLQCHDRFPRAQAAQLWNALVGMTGRQTPEVVSELLHHLGPELVRALIFSFGGDVNRSELDVMARTFRKMQARQQNTKQWAEQSLMNSTFPSQRASEDDKRKFVSQLMVSRDDKTIERVVRDFWTLCRGAPAGYS